MNFTAEVPVNTWLGIGFGKTMTNTDMILMQAYSQFSKSAVSDMWSTSHSRTPQFDSVDNLTVTSITENPGRSTQTFKFSRKLNTNDSVQDYVIPVDEAITMCFAVNYNVANFVQHQDYGNFPMYLTPDGRVLFSTKPTAANQGSGVIGSSQISVKDEYFVTHGVTLYIAWFVIGFLILASKRYLPAPYMAMHVVHAISGLMVLVATLYMSLAMIQKYNWSIKAELHPILGTIVLVLVLLVVYLGLSRIAIGKQEPTPWVTADDGVQMAKAHKFVGYIVLGVANLACMTGVIHYVNDMLQKPKALPLSLLTLPLFALLVIILEINR